MNWLYSLMYKTIGLIGLVNRMIKLDVRSIDYALIIANCCKCVKCKITIFSHDAGKIKKTRKQFDRT